MVSKSHFLCQLPPEEAIAAYGCRFIQKKTAVGRTAVKMGYFFVFFSTRTAAPPASIIKTAAIQPQELFLGTS